MADSPKRNSKRLLWDAVNKYPQLFCSSLRRSGALEPCEDVEWASPLAKDDYHEYGVGKVVENLCLSGSISVPLKEFWPSPGPVWDGLGVSSQGRPILVEAKAHIPEAASPDTKASSKSRKLIEQSLDATRGHFAPGSRADWTRTFYQYANRLAHQYWLREMNKINSSLVFLYFTNAFDMGGPDTEAEWQGATKELHDELGLPASLEKFGVYHAYVDAEQLSNAS